MRRLLPLLVAAIAGLSLTAACSRHDDHRVGDDLKDAGHSVDEAAGSVAHDPDVKRAELDMKDAAHDAAHDLRQAAAEAKVAAHRLAADTRNAAHDCTRRDPDDHYDNDAHND
jgi:hypothetical protein